MMTFRRPSSWFNKQIEPLGVVDVEGYALIEPGAGILTLKPILPGPATLIEIETLRQIRNECAAFMTRDTREIDTTSQIMWWQLLTTEQARLPTRSWFIWLAFDDRQDVIGYAMLRQGMQMVPTFDHRWYASLGLTEQARGKGYGTMIYRALANAGNGPVNALIRKDNIASIRAAEKAGYVVAATGGDPGGIVRMISHGGERGTL